MLKLIKIEFKKALQFKFFLILLIVFCFYIIGLIRYQFIPDNSIYEKYNAFHGWFYTVQDGCFYIIEYLTPIIAIIAYGDSFFNDLKNGYIRMINTRITFKNYVQAKFIVSGLIAALTIVIPSLLLLVLCTLLFKHNIPNGNSYVKYWNPHGELMNIYFNNPFIFIIIAILMMGLFAFSYSSLSFSISLYSKNKIIPLVSPFLIYISFQLLCEFTGKIELQPRLSLLFYIESSHIFILSIAENLLLIIISIILIKNKSRGELVL